ncbi:dTDP-4-dehydrorhamnose 3,5-epimerase [bacterium]|nr:dTDP-4-dehydrorhamnose 3,5-epimerase [bacterium]
MQVRDTDIPDVKEIQPTVHGDERGFFLETYSARRYAEHGIPTSFVQDNWSRSRRGILRGLHYQVQQAQGKLVQVMSGEVFDVAVDLRRGSETFGRWVGVILSAGKKNQLWIPPGFAHGFLVLSDVADFVYKCTDYYAPEHERCLSWNDPTVAIDWPFDSEPTLSEKDHNGQSLNEVRAVDV